MIYLLFNNYMLCYRYINIPYDLKINRTLYEHLKKKASVKVC